MCVSTTIKTLLSTKDSSRLMVSIAMLQLSTKKFLVLSLFLICCYLLKITFRCLVCVGIYCYIYVTRLRSWFWACDSDSKKVHGLYSSH